MIDAVPGFFYVFDASRTYLLWNKRLEEVSGYSGAEIAETSTLKLIDVKDRRAVADRIGQAFIQGSAAIDASLVTKDGRSIPYHFTANVVQYRGKACLAGVGLDVSKRKLAEEQLRYAVLHDPLTALANRRVLSARLLRSTRTALRKHEQVAVLCLDLDRFKVMNDTLGHGAGDELLKTVAQRLNANVRAEDTVARLGGDEFVIVADVPRSEGVVALVATLWSHFASRFR